MEKIAIVFPGQASQYVGMGRDLYESESDVRRLYNIASEEIGHDIARLSFEGPADKLKETRFTQPAILLHSLAILQIMKNELPRASFTAGHSLGEYGALALSGVLSPEASVKAVVRRATLMEEACRQNPGTMAAIIGLDENKIIEICEEASKKSVVVPANYNSGNQLVISGAIAGVEEACRICREQGAKRAMILEVGGAFHSPLMEPAKDGMKDYLDSIDFNMPEINVVPNVTGTSEKNSDKLKNLLVEQITSPVRWYQTMQYFRQNEVDIMIEIGPGKVLSGLAKRELKDARILNIDTLEDIQSFVAVATG